jgi:hypothetical protein
MNATDSEELENNESSRNADDVYDYDVRFTVKRSLVADEEPSEYVIEIDGSIEFASDTPEVVGRISARVVQAARALNDGEYLFEVCDSVDQSLHDYASAVYDYEEESIVESISDGCAGADVLIVQSIQIIAAHRGRRLGLLAMRRTIDTFGGGCAAVVIKPFPLQFSACHNASPPEQSGWDTRMALRSFDADEKSAFTKLRKYCERPRLMS